MFNFEKFKTAKIAVNVETQEEYDEFMRMCEDEGLEWYGGEELTDKSMFKDFASNTCIRARLGVMLYSDCEFYEEEGYQIIKFKEIKENKQMTKADLRTGMIVTLRNGSEYVVFRNCSCQSDDSRDVLVNEPIKYWGDLDQYDDNLMYKNEDFGGCDIVKVKLAPDPYSFMDLEWRRENRKLLWERKAPTRMTLSEIKQKLGIENLEIVE